ncbi:MAG: TatD family hydrolase [Elusimicrobia bacterium]|nr:TatD family hydrolase [Elusimicrobiota bacterium]
MIDTHAHLNDSQFDSDRDQVIRKAFQSGVQKIIEIADGPMEWGNALALCRKYPNQIFCAWGFHPHHALEWQDNYLSDLGKNLDSPLIAAIGEIGIDYAKSQAPVHIQHRTFRKMVELSNGAGKPLVLHCRNGKENGDAFKDMFHILQKYWKPKLGSRKFHGVLHCFSGGMTEAREALSLRLALGVDGPVTYPKNEELRSTLVSVGLDRIVLETDSPFLPPQGKRGQRNDPSQVTEIAQRLSSLFNVSKEEVVSVTTRNALELFNLC